MESCQHLLSLRYEIRISNIPCGKHEKRQINGLFMLICNSSYTLHTPLLLFFFVTKTSIGTSNSEQNKKTLHVFCAYWFDFLNFHPKWQSRYKTILDIDFHFAMENGIKTHARADTHAREFSVQKIHFDWHRKYYISALHAILSVGTSNTIQTVSFRLLRHKKKRHQTEQHERRKKKWAREKKWKRGWCKYAGTLLQFAQSRAHVAQHKHLHKMEYHESKYKTTKTTAKCKQLT